MRLTLTSLSGATETSVSTLLSYRSDCFQIYMSPNRLIPNCYARSRLLPNLYAFETIASKLLRYKAICFHTVHYRAGCFQIVRYRAICLQIVRYSAGCFEIFTLQIWLLPNCSATEPSTSKLYATESASSKLYATVPAASKFSRCKADCFQIVRYRVGCFQIVRYSAGCFQIVRYRAGCFHIVRYSASRFQIVRYSAGCFQIFKLQNWLLPNCTLQYRLIPNFHAAELTASMFLRFRVKYIQINKLRKRFLPNCHPTETIVSKLPHFITYCFQNVLLLELISCKYVTDIYTRHLLHQCKELVVGEEILVLLLPFTQSQCQFVRVLLSAHSTATYNSIATPATTVVRMSGFWIYCAISCRTAFV